MDDIGDVGGRAAGGQIGGGTQKHHLAFLRYRVGRVADAFHHQVRFAIEFEAREYLLVADAAARVLVHDLDELGDGPAAVADHVAGRAPGRRDQFAIDHQQAMVGALLEGLHDHRARMLAGGVECGADLIFAGDVDGDAAAMVAVVGLEHHRPAESLRGLDRFGLAGDQMLAWHRQAERAEDLVGLFLVAGQFDRDMGGLAGDGGLDALLVLAVAELHQRLVVQPQPGDAALLGRAHQRGGGRPQCATLGVADEVVARRFPVPVRRHAAGGADAFGQQRAQQAQRQFARGDAFLTLGVFVDDGVDARSAVDAAGLAEGDVLAGDVLEFDRNVFQHVAQPGAFALAHAAQEAAGLAVGTAVLGQAWHRGHQAVDEAGAQARGGPLFQVAQVQQQPDHREVRMLRGANVDGAFENAHAGCPLVGSGLAGRQSAGRSPPRMQVEGGAGDQDVDAQPQQADGIVLAGLGH